MMWVRVQPGGCTCWSRRATGRCCRGSRCDAPTADGLQQLQVACGKREQEKSSRAVAVAVTDGSGGQALRLGGAGQAGAVEGPATQMDGAAGSYGAARHKAQKQFEGLGVTAKPQSNGTGNRQPAESEVSGCNRKQGTTGYLPPNTYRLGSLRWLRLRAASCWESRRPEPGTLAES